MNPIRTLQPCFPINTNKKLISGEMKYGIYENDFDWQKGISYVNYVCSMLAQAE
jgi:hypothetical protein